MEPLIAPIRSGRAWTPPLPTGSGLTTHLVVFLPSPPITAPCGNGQLYEWTPYAVAKGYRQQLREEFQILTYVDDGLLTGPGGQPFGDSQFVINCPPVQRLQ